MNDDKLEKFFLDKDMTFISEFKIFCDVMHHHIDNDVKEHRKYMNRILLNDCHTSFYRN